MKGVTTTFTMDLASGLTQALSYGTNDYIYGIGRIAQVSGSGVDYFLGDALGSVRQLTDSTGAVTFAQGYAPPPLGDGLPTKLSFDRQVSAPPTSTALVVAAPMPTPDYNQRTAQSTPLLLLWLYPYRFQG